MLSFAHAKRTVRDEELGFQKLKLSKTCDGYIGRATYLVSFSVPMGKFTYRVVPIAVGALRIGWLLIGIVEVLQCGSACTTGTGKFCMNSCGYVLTSWPQSY